MIRHDLVFNTISNGELLTLRHARQRCRRHVHLSCQTLCTHAKVSQTRGNISQNVSCPVYCQAWFLFRPKDRSRLWINHPSYHTRKRYFTSSRMDRNTHSTYGAHQECLNTSWRYQRVYVVRQHHAWYGRSFPPIPHECNRFMLSTNATPASMIRKRGQLSYR